MANELFKLDILGTSFLIKSKDNIEEISKIAEYLRLKIDEIAGESRLTDPLKISLLASLNLVDELFKMKRALYQQNSKEQATPESIEAERITRSLLKRVEESLQDQQPAIVAHE